MNEFTKEELQCILEWSQELGHEFGTNGDELEMKLDAKLKSMIDNYCEHPKEEMWGDGGQTGCNNCGWVCP